MARVLTLRDIAGFFLPVVAMAQLIMISHSLVHAVVARQAQAAQALAAYSLAHAVHSVIAASAVPVVYLVLSYVRDRSTLHRLARFGAVLVVGIFCSVLLISLTPLGDWVFGRLLGGSPLVVQQARGAFLVLSLVLPAMLIRDLCMGLVMQARRTSLAAYGILVRLAVMGATLPWLPHVVEGALVGAWMFQLSMTCEAAFMALVTRPYYRRLPRSDAQPLSYGVMLRFGWPLAASHLTESGLLMVVNFSLGQLPNSDRAQGAFLVVSSLINLLLVPLRSLDTAAQTLVNTRKDLRPFAAFTLLAVAAFSLGLALLFLTPLRPWVLGTVMGLTDPLRDLAAPAMQLAILLPLAWGGGAALRGLLVGLRRTEMLAFSGVVRLAVLAAVSSLMLVFAGVNGVVVGVLALFAAYCAETGVLLQALLRSARRTGFYPPS